MGRDDVERLVERQRGVDRALEQLAALGRDHLGEGLGVEAREGEAQAPVHAVRHDLHTSQFKNNHSTEMCSSSEAGSYVRLIDSCITQLKAQGPSRICNESKEEEEEEAQKRENVKPRHPYMLFAMI